MLSSIKFLPTRLSKDWFPWTRVGLVPLKDPKTGNLIDFLHLFDDNGNCRDSKINEILNEKTTCS